MQGAAETALVIDVVAAASLVIRMNSYGFSAGTTMSSHRQSTILLLLSTKNVLDYYDLCDRKSFSHQSTAMDRNAS